MKQIKSNVNINQLLHPLPETAQETMSGGAGDYLLEIEGIQGGTISGAQIRVPIKVKHNV